MAKLRSSNQKPPRSLKKQVVTFRLTEDQLAKLEKYAKGQLGTDRKPVSPQVAARMIVIDYIEGRLRDLGKGD